MKNINTELAADIIELIFSKLNFLNLGSCRLVCRAWNEQVTTAKSLNPINSPLFCVTIHPSSSKIYCIDLDGRHLDGMDVIASFNFDPTCSGRFLNKRPCYQWVSIKILCFCNGLALLDYLGEVGRMLSVWNPITNEYIKLSSTCSRKYFYGFGFSPHTKCYKILRYHSGQTQALLQSRALVDISEVGTGGWTRVEFDLGSLHGNGTYFNGALYWIGISMTSASAIFRFDLQSETFEEISFPQSEILGRLDLLKYGFLGLLNGNLYLTFRAKRCKEYRVWKMGDDCLWIEAFVVPLTCYYYRTFTRLQLIKTCQDGKIMCFLMGYDLDLLILYDQKTQAIQTLRRQDVQTKNHLEVFHVNCFNFDPLHKILAGDSC